MKKTTTWLFGGTFVIVAVGLLILLTIDNGAKTESRSNISQNMQEKITNTKQVNIIKAQSCPECNGKGEVLVPEKQVTCPKCNGKGRIPNPINPGGRGLQWECKYPYGQCNGTGKITEPERSESCKKCSGRGLL